MQRNQSTPLPSCDPKTPRPRLNTPSTRPSGPAGTELTASSSTVRLSSSNPHIRKRLSDLPYVASFSQRDGAPSLSLTGKKFVLEVENQRAHEKVIARLKKYGATIATTIEEDSLPWCVISDHPSVPRIQCRTSEVSDETVKKLPMILRDAVRLKLRVRTVDTFLEQLERFVERSKKDKAILEAPQKKRQSTGSSGNSIQHLRPPFIKLEDDQGLFQPLFKQYDESNAQNTIFLGRHFGKSLFHRAPPERSQQNRLSIQPTQRRDHHMPKSGYCDICGTKYDNSKLHFASVGHQKAVSMPGLYAGVDALCGSFVDFIKVPGKETLPRAHSLAQTPPLSDDASSATALSTSSEESPVWDLGPP